MQDSGNAASGTRSLRPSAEELADRERRIEDELALEALMRDLPHDSSAMWRAPSHFRESKHLVLQCVHVNGHSLVFVSANLQADRDVVKVAVQQDGGALRYASDDLRADPEIVRLAVRADGSSLFYADSSLQADKDIALAAVSQDAFAVPFVESRLRSSPEVQRQASRTLERTRSSFLSRDQIDEIGVVGQVSPGGRMSQREGSRGFDLFALQAAQAEEDVLLRRQEVPRRLGQSICGGRRPSTDR